MMIKLLIGGSPCTFWSIAQKNGRETEAEGMGWELFKNYLIAKEKFKPDLFLYENNKSAAQAIKDQIAYELGVDLMHINSALVSAQNRQRFYAFNWKVDQPEDRGILLRDVLEPCVLEQSYETQSVTASPVGTTGDGKSYCLTANYQFGMHIPGTLTRGERTIVAEPVKVLSEREMDYMIRPTKDGRNQSDFAHFHDGNADKSRCITATTAKGVPYNVLCEPARVSDIGSTAQAHRVYSCDGKSVMINAGGGGQGGKTGLYLCPTTEKHLYEVKDGLITIKDKQYPIKLADGYYIIRKLTPTECERLQTIPDGYTEGVSNAQRYKALGNGWTAEVIIHILNGALANVPRDEEIVVLSMYDGIATGRYCLDKMGFTNVRYYAYEIDKYAKQIAMKNYPDIIQCGDAFDVRHPDWTIGY
jgi:DNA (cytosine-5)-methyltransferase 3A